MASRKLTAGLLLVGLALTSGQAEAFPWPSRWTNKSTPAPSPGKDVPSPSTTPNPAAPPVAAWPPRARDLLPEATLPKLPSPIGMPVPVPRPVAPQVAPAAQPGLASHVVLGRPVPLPVASPEANLATLPAVMPTPQVTTNPTPAPSPTPQPYTPPGVGPLPGTEFVQQVGFETPRTTVRGQVYEQDSDILPVRLDGPPPVAPPPGGGGVTNPLPPLPEGRYNAGVEMGQQLGRPPGSSFPDFFGTGGGASVDGAWCVSDHDFDGAFISPVTSPFSFEDPRSLTEARAVFIYGLIPNKSALAGGSTGFVGLQGRLSFGPSFSIVINKLGGVGIYPEDMNPAMVDGSTGFAEVNIGPKWTFWRSPSMNMVAAAGLTFQLPVGSKYVYQNTGTLGLDPYLSYGWNLGRSSYGSFNFLTTVGYNFAIDNDRSEYFHSHYHVSYDVLNMQKVYPLLEMNWYKRTQSGTSTPFNFEGRDLVNFGSGPAAGWHSYLSLAAGARFKLNENIQSGLACEWNLKHNESSLEHFRFTFDLILRY